MSQSLGGLGNQVTRVDPNRFGDATWASEFIVFGLKNHWLCDLGQADTPLWTSFSLSLKWVLTTLRGSFAKAVAFRGRMSDHHPERCRNEGAEMHWTPQVWNESQKWRKGLA